MTDEIALQLKAELELSHKEIKDLHLSFETQVGELKSEVNFLKEKLMSQQEMLQIAVEFADKLGKELKNLKKRVDSGNFQSIH